MCRGPGAGAYQVYAGAEKRPCGHSRQLRTRPQGGDRVTECHCRPVALWHPVSLGHPGCKVDDRGEDGQGRSMMTLFQELMQEIGSSVDQTGGLVKSG